MDILPSVDIFRELQDIHDTGFFTAKPSLDDHWQQDVNFLVQSNGVYSFDIPNQNTTAADISVGCFRQLIVGSMFCRSIDSVHCFDIPSQDSPDEAVLSHSSFFTAKPNLDDHWQQVEYCH
ncbi:hypothetical protein GWI33_015562 [Rhynchophorus ferrugineus]|uniref:Uncharacterized protein n=1 Tax=Rhynchophorus ferrugineus TaxID=354439 RepID=A0A834M803_RHYFE|nr:hypothetical protein GWI33_015562 [Rhynchophorus ferrugineus]